MARFDDWTFPHEDLLVYQDACAFVKAVLRLRWPSGHGELKRQLTRAALSISLNICEGRSQIFAGNAGKNYYRIALGSAAECHGALHMLGLIRGRELCEETLLLRAIGARLTGLLHEAA